MMELFKIIGVFVLQQAEITSKVQAVNRLHCSPLSWAKVCYSKSYARIGWQNLINFGIIPSEFINANDWAKLEPVDILRIEGLRTVIKKRALVTATIVGKNIEISLTYNITERQVELF